MTVQTAALSKLYISTTATTVSTQSAFEGLTYSEVGEITDLGEFGSEYSTVTHVSLADRLVRKFKGTEDPGTITLQMGMDPDDAGQTVLKTALGVDTEYGFKVTLNDAGSGSPSSPTTFYFRARVMSYKRQVGSAESIVAASTTIGINTRPIEVAAV